MTFIKQTKTGWRIDPHKKLGSLISAEIRLKEIIEFTKYVKNKSILDVGCGDKPYEAILKKKTSLYVGVDIPWSNHDVFKADIFSEADCLPFSDNTFDSILCTEVIEHLPDTFQALKAFYRICKPDGYLFLSAPFFHGIHEPPYDYYRFTVYGLKYLIEASGFELISIKPLGEMIAVNITLFARFLLKVTRALSKALQIPVIRNPFLNPVLFFFAYLPQKLYLKLYHYAGVSPNSLLNYFLTKLCSYCLGYVLIAQKTNSKSP